MHPHASSSCERQRQQYKSRTSEAGKYNVCKGRDFLSRLCLRMSFLSEAFLVDHCFSKVQRFHWLFNSSNTSKEKSLRATSEALMVTTWHRIYTFSNDTSSEVPKLVKMWLRPNTHTHRHTNTHTHTYTHTHTHTHTHMYAHIHEHKTNAPHTNTHLRSRS